MLIDNCAAVSIGSSKLMKLIKALVKDSNCRVITADGSITSVNGVVVAKFRVGSQEYVIRILLEEFLELGGLSSVAAHPDQSNHGSEYGLPCLVETVGETSVDRPY